MASIYKSVVHPNTGSDDVRGMAAMTDARRHLSGDMTDMKLSLDIVGDQPNDDELARFGKLEQALVGAVGDRITLAPALGLPPLVRAYP